jgi:hypothetical protein
MSLDADDQFYGAGDAAGWCSAVIVLFVLFYGTAGWIVFLSVVLLVLDDCS